ncbi:carboxypeptidase-like regulatory domain-containing protein [Winogradskyella eckloniae]|uniref:carboxypeptidase-like regulatory domain-containing protein n=1 Tax=Winogradskyella eckloniae TaxID=1089306 RepID=UPI001565F5F6|nr:carboxypeptidase-like regulatory domain-containing protein [Winogradskyella eckloniae]NRD21335.1 carboxypeptidase-like regulatory domain-containing protein [Winogradskyella eckloniae]
MKKMTLLAVVLCFNLVAMAQISITGTVTNDSIPLESANVFIKNSTKGIATNAIGEFKLKAIKGDTLSISYLGYKTKEVVLDKTHNLDINLEEDSFDEVVLIAYGSHRRTSLCCGGIRICELHIDNKSNNKNKLFPNPSSNGIFQLQLNEDYDNVEISIANMSGRIIQNSTFQKFNNPIDINVSEFSSGVYLVNIIADGKRLKTIKAVKL